MQQAYTNQGDLVIAISEAISEAAYEDVTTEGGPAPRQATSKEVISRLVPTKTSIAFNMMNLRG